ncbi:hypothetical protein J6590_107814, partial [Homalodisca vitripennis]
GQQQAQGVSRSSVPSLPTPCLSSGESLPLILSPGRLAISVIIVYHMPHNMQCHCDVFDYPADNSR